MDEWEVAVDSAIRNKKVATRSLREVERMSQSDEQCTAGSEPAGDFTPPCRKPMRTVAQSRPALCAPWAASLQGPLSMGFPRGEY